MDLKKYFDVKSITGNKQQAIAKETALALRSFCEQEPELEQAIEQSNKSYQQCLDSAINGIAYSISDFEVYSRAVSFYFSTATVHFNMTIDLSGNNGYEAPPITVTHSEAKPPESGTEEKKTSLSFDLDDILDF